MTASRAKAPLAVALALVAGVGGGCADDAAPTDAGLPDAAATDTLAADTLPGDATVDVVLSAGDASAVRGDARPVGSRCARAGGICACACDEEPDHPVSAPGQLNDCPQPCEGCACPLLCCLPPAP